MLLAARGPDGWWEAALLRGPNASHEAAMVSVLGKRPYGAHLHLWGCCGSGATRAQAFAALRARLQCIRRPYHEEAPTLRP